jgi:hypothetical protein
VVLLALPKSVEPSHAQKPSTKSKKSLIAYDDWEISPITNPKTAAKLNLAAVFILLLSNIKFELTF